MLLAALFGMAVAGRQILLHITPGTGSYGAPLFGLHFYTWSFLLFAASDGALALLTLWALLRERGSSWSAHS